MVISERLRVINVEALADTDATARSSVVALMADKVPTLILNTDKSALLHLWAQGSFISCWQVK